MPRERDLNVSLHKKETNEILNLFPETKTENVYMENDETLENYIKKQNEINENYTKDSEKLSHIDDRAQKNQNAFSAVKSGNFLVEAEKEKDVLELMEGDNISIDIIAGKIIISSGQNDINRADVNHDGLMTASDYKKLKNIEDGANKYVHPTSSVLPGEYIHVTVDSNGHVTSANNDVLQIHEGGTGVDNLNDLKKLLDVGNSEIESSVKENSNNPVTSSGIFQALKEKASVNHGNHVPDSTDDPNSFSFLKEGNTWEVIPDANTSQKGVVQLTNEIGESESLGVSQKGLYDVNKKINEEISSLKGTTETDLDTLEKVGNKIIKTQDDLSSHTGDTTVHVTSAERTKWNAKSDVKLDTELSNTSTNAISNKAVKDALDKKANSDDVTSHTSDTTVHVTSAERTKWNNAAAGTVTVDSSISSTSTNPVQNKVIKTELDKKANSDDLSSHTGDTTVHVTSAERTKWNKILEDAKAYTDEKYGSIDTIDFYVIESGKTHTSITSPSVSLIYLEKSSNSTQYESWIYRDKWINIGSDDIALDNYYNKTETEELIDNSKVTVDSTISSSSTNPVQNKVIKTELDKKADSSDVTSHTNDNTVHVTSAEKEKWNNAAAGTVTIDSSLSTTSTNPVQNKVIKTELDKKANSIDVSSHIGDTTVHITASERTKWNAKSDVKLDTELSNTSTNAISNKAVKDALDKKADSSDLNKKVDTVSGKGLSTNDFTDALKKNYDAAYSHSTSSHAPSDAEKNVIQGIQKNGVDLTPNTTTRKVNISVPTKVSELTNDSNFLNAHPTISVGTDTTSTKTIDKTKDDTFTTIDSVTRDSNGHVTKVNTKTITIPKQASSSGGGVVRSSTAPSDTSVLWIDSGNSNIPKYYNGTAWVILPATWG